MIFVDTARFTQRSPTSVDRIEDPKEVIVDEARETFSFGANWRWFLDQYMTDGQADEARESLSEFLGLSDLKGKTFLDIGCGSGLFSLGAHRLGAERVVSFDVDPQSVECCEHLWERAGKPDNWTVLSGSILDSAFVSNLPSADVVYSWGVLHHTGSMWEAIRNAAGLVPPGGYFYIAIYNRTGGRFRGSKFWYRVKRLYNRSPRIVRWAMEWVHMAYACVGMVVRLKNPIKEIRNYGQQRGMSWRTDSVDWLGGYPYEYATVAEIFAYCRHELGLRLEKLQQDQGLGCNEFLFTRPTANQTVAAD
jgi:2-polyprenyl-6-hydroxyphenyl methylase/3-demethylubiquinone-9 3-methyltransferase